MLINCYLAVLLRLLGYKVESSFTADGQQRQETNNMFLLLLLAS